MRRLPSRPARSLLAAVLLLAALPAGAAKRRTSRKPPPEPAAAPAEAPAAAPAPAVTAAAPAPAAPAAAEEAPRRARAARRAEPAAPAHRGWRLERLGLGLGAQGEASRMEGEQWIHTFRQDESFNYGRGGPAFNVWAMGELFPHVWVGPAVRVMGGYASDRYDFGLLQELGGVAEWALPAFEQFEVVLGGRANAAVLLPGGDLAAEIQRLQAQGAGVWNVPRVGWSLGVGAGLRRKMAERFWLRLDASGQMGRIYLFATDELVDDLRFRKFWSSDLRRMELSLSLEVGL